MPHVPRIGILCETQFDVRGLQQALMQRGVLTDMLETVQSANAYCARLNPLALILDLTGHIEEGLGAISTLRHAGCESLIVALADTADPLVQVEALVAGADDFQPLPSTVAELLQRLDLLLQKTGTELPKSGGGAKDQLTSALTPMEWRILETLRDAAPEPVSREEINWRVRHQQLSPDDRTIDVYVSHIRAKLRLIETGVSIQTVRGKGFRAVEKLSRTIRNVS